MCGGRNGRDDHDHGHHGDGHDRVSGHDHGRGHDPGDHDPGDHVKSQELPILQPYQLIHRL